MRTKLLSAEAVGKAVGRLVFVAAHGRRRRMMSLTCRIAFCCLHCLTELPSVVFFRPVVARGFMRRLFRLQREVLAVSLVSGK